MNDPYSDDRDGNPYAYYEEIQSPEEKIPQQEPRIVDFPLTIYADIRITGFWGIGWLTYDPWKFGFHSFIRQSSIPGEYYYVRYPNGDGYLLYPDIGKQASGFRLQERTSKSTLKPEV